MSESASSSSLSTPKPNASKLKASASAFVPSFLAAPAAVAPELMTRLTPPFNSSISGVSAMNNIPGIDSKIAPTAASTAFYPGAYGNPGSFGSTTFSPYTDVGPNFDDDTEQPNKQGRRTYTIAMLCQLGQEYTDKPSCLPDILDVMHPACHEFCNKASKPKPKPTVVRDTVRTEPESQHVQTPARQRSAPPPPPPSTRGKKAPPSRDEKARERERERERAKRYEKYSAELNLKENDAIDFTGCGSMEEMLARLKKQEAKQDRNGNRRSRGGRSQVNTPIPEEKLGPLNKSENRFIPSAQKKKMGIVEVISNEEEAETAKMLKALMSQLNKITLENFESVSIKVLQTAAEAKSEVALRQIVRVIFEKAVGELKFAPMYAKLCVLLDKGYDPSVPKRRVLSAAGKNKPVAPQTAIYMPRFSNGRPVARPTAGDSQTVKHACHQEESFRTCMLRECYKQLAGEETNTLPEGVQRAFALKSYDSADDKASKRKQRVRGTIVFMGELFKRGLLPWHVVHLCLSMLLDDPSTVHDDEAEHVYVLLQSVGKSFDLLLKSNKKGKGKGKKDEKLEDRSLPVIHPISAPVTPVKPVLATIPVLSPVNPDFAAKPISILGAGIFGNMKADVYEPEIDLGLGDLALPGLDQSIMDAINNSRSDILSNFSPIPLSRMGPALSITVNDADTQGSPALIATVAPAGDSEESFVSDSPLLRAWERKLTDNKPVFSSLDSPSLASSISPVMCSITSLNMSCDNASPITSTGVGAESPMLVIPAISSSAIPVVDKGLSPADALPLSSFMTTPTQQNNSTLPIAALTSIRTSQYVRSKRPTSLEDLSMDLDKYYMSVSTLIAPSSGLSSRQRFLLQDILDLRGNNWMPRKAAAAEAPKKLNEKDRDAKSGREKDSTPRRVVGMGAGMCISKGLADNDDVRGNMPTTIFKNGKIESEKTPAKTIASSISLVDPSFETKIRALSRAGGNDKRSSSRPTGMFAALIEEEEEEEEEREADEIILSPFSADEEPVKLGRDAFVIPEEEDEDEEQEEDAVSPLLSSQSYPNGVSPSVTLRALTNGSNAVRSLVEELLTTGDAVEASNCVTDVLLKNPVPVALNGEDTFFMATSPAGLKDLRVRWIKLQLREVVYSCFDQTLMSASASKLKAVTDMLDILTSDLFVEKTRVEAHNKGLVTTADDAIAWKLTVDDIMAALLRITAQLQDISVDVPNAFSIIAEIILTLASADENKPALVSVATSVATLLAYTQSKAQEAYELFKPSIHDALDIVSRQDPITDEIFYTLFRVVLGNNDAFIANYDISLRYDDDNVNAMPKLSEYDEMFSLDAVYACQRSVSRVLGLLCTEPNEGIVLSDSVSMSPITNGIDDIKALTKASSLGEFLSFMVPQVDNAVLETVCDMVDETVRAQF